MKQSIAAARKAAEAVTAALARINRIDAERAKFAAAIATKQAEAEALRLRAGQALAAAAIANGAGQKDADDLAAQAAEAAAACGRLVMASDGLAEARTATEAELEAARSAEAEAKRRAVQAYFDALGEKYLRVSEELAELHRQVWATGIIHNGLRTADDPQWTPFLSEYEGRHLRLPALRHPAFSAAVLTGDGSITYGAEYELTRSHEGRQYATTRAVAAELEKLGLVL